MKHLLPAAVLLASFAATSSAAEHWVYVGTYTRGDSDGIYVARFDDETGELGEPKLAAKAVNPSFLGVHPNGRFLYAVGEISNFGGTKEGGVTAFSLDPKSGVLRELNAQSSGGAGPCHVSLDPKGTSAFVANYGGGSVASFPIAEDGSLGKRSSFHQHVGSSVDPRRQKGPHGHSINVDATGRFAVAADLGLDKLLVYKVAAKSGALEPNDPPAFATPPGGGPRHFAFHPNGRFAYANLEMTREVEALHWDADSGTFERISVHSTLPKDAEAAGSTAETRVHPSGRFVYVSNRGHDSVAVFRVNEKSGDLIPVGHVSTGGKTPRNFNLDPSGRWLIAANQNSGNVVVFSVDEKTGLPKPTGREIAVANPVCIRFAPAK